MKIVLDTNVILSALISQGISFRVLDICIDKHQLFISPWIINEVLLKLDVKLHVLKSEIDRVSLFLYNVFNNITPNGPLPTICRDSDDNNILLLAQYVKANLIITGDNDLLSLNNYLYIKIISPRQFIENHNQS
jgi:uncharacterized protein